MVYIIYLLFAMVNIVLPLGHGVHCLSLGYCVNFLPLGHFVFCIFRPWCTMSFFMQCCALSILHWLSLNHGGVQ